MDTFVLTRNNLESVHQEVNEDEELIFAELYREIVESDTRTSRTRSHRGRGRGVPIGRGKGLLVRRPPTSTGEGTTTYVRRGSTSSNPSPSDGLVGLPHRDPTFDDEGNLVSDADYEPSSASSREEDSSSENSLDEDSDSIATHASLVPSDDSDY